jgi:hypothetical protein
MFVLDFKVSVSFSMITFEGEARMGCVVRHADENGVQVPV